MCNSVEQRVFLSATSTKQGKTEYEFQEAHWQVITYPSINTKAHTYYSGQIVKTENRLSYAH